MRGLCSHQADAGRQGAPRRAPLRLTVYKPGALQTPGHSTGPELNRKFGAGPAAVWSLER